MRRVVWGALEAGPSRVLLGVLGAGSLCLVGFAGGPAALLVAAAVILAVHASVRTLVRPEHRARLWSWVMAATLIRIAFAAALHLVLVQRNPHGALFLDDAGYVQIAAALAQSWRGEAPPPYIDPSFDHNFVKGAALLFLVAGSGALALKLVNTLLGVLAALVLYRAMLSARLPGAVIGMGLMLVFPSLVLWSALALKDTFSLLFSLIALWSVTAFAQSRRWIWFLGTIAALLALENVRAFLFVILAVSWPLGLFIALPRDRIVPAAAAALAAGLLLVSTSALHFLNPNMVTASTYIRQAMARGANSGFVAPLPVLRAEACTLFVVSVPGRTAAPGPPRQFYVPPGTELVVEAPGREPIGREVVVRPGDFVAVAGATPCPSLADPSQTVVVSDPRSVVTPAPAPAVAGPGPRPVVTPAPVAAVVISEARNVVSTPAPATQESFAFSRDVAAALVHLPVGVFALLAAPVPLMARTTAELAATPEMLVWYPIVVLAVIGVVRIGAQGRARYAYGLIVLLVVSLVLSLYEGNLGTLVRHRAMVIPFVIALAAAALAELRVRRMR